MLPPTLQGPLAAPPAPASSPKARLVLPCLLERITHFLSWTNITTSSAFPFPAGSPQSASVAPVYGPFSGGQRTGRANLGKFVSTQSPRPPHRRLTPMVSHSPHPCRVAQTSACLDAGPCFRAAQPAAGPTSQGGRHSSSCQLHQQAAWPLLHEPGPTAPPAAGLSHHQAQAGIAAHPLDAVCSLPPLSPDLSGT